MIHLCECSVATVLYDKVLLSHKLSDCRTERIVNSSSYQPSERVLMSQADIFDFMRFIFDCGQVNTSFSPCPCLSFFYSPTSALLIS